MEELTNAVWVLAALAAAGRADRLPEALGQVLGAAGYAELTSDGWELLPAYRELRRAPDLPRQLAGVLRQAADLAEGTGRQAHGPEELGPPARRPEAHGQGREDSENDQERLADGAVSGAQVSGFLDLLEDRFPRFRELLRGPGVRFLDVGVGVGGITAAVLQRSPDSSAVGLDLDGRMLRLAAEYLERHGLTARVELRHQDVATLTERERYDLAWLPLVALAPSDAVAALPRVRTALRPGGWLLTATALPAPAAGDAVATTQDHAAAEGVRPSLGAAIVRWRLAHRGVTCWDAAELAENLTAAGYHQIHVLRPGNRAMPLVVARAPT